VPPRHGLRMHIDFFLFYIWSLSKGPRWELLLSKYETTVASKLTAKTKRGCEINSSCCLYVKD